MVGELKNFGAMVEKKAVEDESYATNKELIMGKHSQDVIGGAMNDVEQENNLMGRTEVTEEELILDILRYLSPKNPRLWQDEEIKGLIRKFVQERPPKKIVTTSDSEENLQPSEETTDMIKNIKPEKPSEKKPSQFKLTEKNLAKVGGHARACKDDEKDED